MKYKQTIVLVVDVNEKGSAVFNTLVTLPNIELRIEKLSVGDYQLSDRIVVERKTVEDFRLSIIDKRLFNQAILMRESFELPILIVEGEGVLGHPGIHPNAVRGALSSVLVVYGISVVSTVNAIETAHLLVTMARQEQRGVAEISYKHKRKARTLKEQQERIIESLPGIGLRLARSLLSKFATVERVMTATEKELVDVKNIGPQKAALIRKVLCTEYSQK